MSGHAVTGWLFGKLPTHGDFISRGIDAATRQPVDDWLSLDMSAARDAFGDRFASRWDHAPAWHFAAREADDWLGGALCPSMDGAGRRFPVVVMLRANDGPHAAALAGKAEGAVADALAHGWDADRLMEQLAGLTAAPGDEAPPVGDAGGWWLADMDGAVVATLAGRRPPGLIARMLEQTP